MAQDLGLTLCENTGFFLRLALLGPSGSGKSYTALRIATGLDLGKVAVIDTENRSARRYAKSFLPHRFFSIELSNFAPQDYIDAIKRAAAAGIDVLIVDSLTHAWTGKGGVLEMADKEQRKQKGGNSFTAWRNVTPEHNALVEAMLQAQMHLIVTMRVKTEYVIEKDSNGKSVPRKVGMAPVQRDGLEYEFDVVGEMTPEHEFMVSKTRFSPIADAIIRKPGQDLAEQLRGWVTGADGVMLLPEPTPAAGRSAPGSANPPPPPPPELSEAAIRAEIAQIEPWIAYIAACKTEEALDAARAELNAKVVKKTKAQGDALRRCIEATRTAIHNAEFDGFAEPPPPPAAAALAPTETPAPAPASTPAPAPAPAPTPAPAPAPAAQEQEPPLEEVPPPSEEPPPSAPEHAEEAPPPPAPPQAPAAPASAPAPAPAQQAAAEQGQVVLRPGEPTDFAGWSQALFACKDAKSYQAQLARLNQLRIAKIVRFTKDQVAEMRGVLESVKVKLGIAQS